MTSLLQAARIANLRMGRAWPLARQEVGQRHLAVHPFAPEMVEKSGLIMAFRARHMPMAGCPPRVHIDIHLVTEAAEGRAFRKFEKAYENDKKNKNTKSKEDLDRLKMSLSASLRLIEEVNPKDLDQVIKISYSSHMNAPTKIQFYNLLKLFQVPLSSLGPFVSGKRTGAHGKMRNRFFCLLSENWEVV